MIVLQYITVQLQPHSCMVDHVICYPHLPQVQLPGGGVSWESHAASVVKRGSSVQVVQFGTVVLSDALLSATAVITMSKLLV